MRDLLEHFDLSHYGTKLHLQFNRRAVACIETDGFFSPVSNTAIPSLAYLDLEATQLRRDNSIPFIKYRRPNPPAVRLQRKRRQCLQPANNIEDPYIAAVLIALAQNQYYYRNQVVPDGPDYKVEL